MNQRQLEEFAKKHGKAQAANMLRIMAGKIEIYKALQTYPGSVLLQELQDRWMVLYQKTLDISATDEDKLEFKVVHKLLRSWAEKVASVMEFNSSEGME